MPVIMKPKLKLALSAIGIPVSTVDAMTAAGITLTSSSAHIKVHEDGIVLDKIPLTSSEVFKLQFGKVDEVSQKSIDETLDKFKYWGVKCGNVVDTASVGTDTTPLSEPEKDKIVEGVTSEYAALSQEMQEDSKPIKLRDATNLYHPVLGTSAGSVYYLVAAASDVKVAVRLKSGSISIRVESSDLTKFSKSFIAAGLTISGGSHASLHTSINNEQEASRVLGSVLLSLGVVYKTAYPAISRVFKVAS